MMRGNNGMNISSGEREIREALNNWNQQKIEVLGLSWCTGTRGNSFCFHNHTWSYDAVR